MSKADYLKKYLSSSEDGKKKKKSKQSSRSRVGNGLKIIEESLQYLLGLVTSSPSFVFLLLVAVMGWK
jgi:pyrroline-5-carboxylate reductase